MTNTIDMVSVAKELVGINVVKGALSGVITVLIIVRVCTSLNIPLRLVLLFLEGYGIEQQRPCGPGSVLCRHMYGLEAGDGWKDRKGDKPGDLSCDIQPDTACHVVSE